MKNISFMNNQLCLFDTNTDIKPNFKKDDKKKPTTETKLIREKIAVYGIEKLIPEEVLSILTGIDVSKCREYIQKYNFSDIVKYLDVLEISPAQCTTSLPHSGHLQLCGFDLI